MTETIYYLLPILFAKCVNEAEFCSLSLTLSSSKLPPPVGYDGWMEFIRNCADVETFTAAVEKVSEIVDSGLWTYDELTQISELRCGVEYEVKKLRPKFRARRIEMDPLVFINKYKGGEFVSKLLKLYPY